MTDDAGISSLDRETLRAATLKRFAGLDLVALGRTFGLPDDRIEMGIYLLGGLDQTKAARAAGLNLTGNNLRSRASKAARSNRMLKFLEAARSHETKVEENFSALTDEQLDQLQSQIAAGERGNPTMLAAIRDLKAERRKAREAQGPGIDPVEGLRRFAGRSVFCAIVATELAHVHGVGDRFGDAAAEAALPEGDRATYRAKRDAIREILGDVPAGQGTERTAQAVA